MSEQEKMDDLIRSKFSEEEFPFDEENWAKAEEMIISTRKKEKRRRWAIIFFFGIIIGILVMSPFVLKNLLNQDNTTATLNHKNTSEKTNAVLNTKKESAPTEETKASEELTEDNKSAEKSNMSEKANPLAAKDEALVSQTSNAKTEVKKTETKTSIINKSLSVKKSQLSSEASVKPNPKGEIPSKKEDLKKPIASSENSGKKDNEKAIVKADEKKQEVLDTNTPLVKEAEKKSKMKTTEVKKKEKTENQEIKKDQLNSTTKPTETKNVGVPATTTLEPVQIAKSDTTPKATVAVVKDSALSKPKEIKKDSALAGTKSTIKPDSLSKKKNTWSISLDAGINGFLSGGSGVSPFGGINITKSISKAVEIGSGIYYTYLPIYTGASTFTTGAVYDFGYTFKLTEIVTDKLHYVTAPLFVKYNFNEKNSVIFGANFYYLFNSSNIITKYEISYAGIQNKTISKATGYFSGFSTYDVGIMAGYRKNLFENFGLALYLNYGLMNIQKTNTTGGSNIHTNISGQLMLTYKLF